MGGDERLHSECPLSFEIALVGTLPGHGKNDQTLPYHQVSPSKVLCLPLARHDVSIVVLFMGSFVEPGCVAVVDVSVRIP